MPDLKTYLADKNSRINAALQNFCRENTRIADAMRYSLMAGGKRLRPVLCIAGAETVGGSEAEVMPIACAIEMIHTYSLIHDDLPAMDNDDLRRGKPTCHIAYNEATAVLAGDALLTLAFEVLASYHSEKMSDVIALIASAAGFKGMIEGQMRDIDAEGKFLMLEELEKLHRCKTGALIEASVISGAMFVGANSDQINALKTYAGHIGLAFQVADDILNVEGDPAVLGKAVGTDESRKKSTYPALMGLEESKAFAKKLIEKAIESLNLFDAGADPLRAVAAYIIERKK